MNLLLKFITLCGCIFLLNAAEINPDQIVELWQPKRETAYFATVANFDPKIRFIFDLRQKMSFDDFDETRHLPIIMQNISPIIANEDSDADDYFDVNKTVMANNKMLQLISGIQKVLNFVKSIFY